MSTATPPTANGATPDARRWIALVALSLATLMVVLDASVINIALPDAQADLHLSTSGRQWAVTAYALTFGGLLLLGGRIADVIGRKRLLLIGLVGFALASALGGAAWDGWVLYAARALQGIFAAAVAPASLALLVVTFTDARERAKAFGVYGAVQGAGGAVGLLLGGSLTGTIGWRATLFINLPIAMVAAAVAVATLREPRNESVRGGRFDVLGAVLATLGPALLVGALSTLESAHVGGIGVTLGLLVAAVLLIIGFAWRQARASAPMLPPRIVTDRARGLGLIASLFVGAGMFGMFLFLAYYLQVELRYSPLAAGLAILPFSLTLIIATQVVARLLPRIGTKLPLLVGMALTTGGAALLLTIDGSSAWLGGALAPMLLMGTGLGLVFVPLNTTILTGVAPADSGVASAVLNAAQQVGGAVGVAVLNVLFASSSAAAGLHGYRVVFAAAAALFAAALLCLLLLPRTKQSPLEPATPDREVAEVHE